MKFGEQVEYEPVKSRLKCEVTRNEFWIFDRVYRMAWKVKVKLEQRSVTYLRRSAGKFRQMFLSLAGNYTVPTSVWRGRGRRSTESHQVTGLITSIVSTSKS